MAKVHRLMQHIKEADRKFGLSKEFINEQKRIQRAKENGELDVGNAWGGPSDLIFDQDEDVMAD